MKRSLSYLLFLSCLTFGTPLFAGTQTLSTYYPAPQGDYLNMTINQVLTMGSQATYTCGSTATDNIYMVDLSGVLEICDKNGTYTLSSNDLWTGDGTNLSPVNTAENVAIDRYLFVGGNGAGTVPAPFPASVGQGTYLDWNYYSGTGDTDFINSHGGGGVSGGGFTFYDTPSSGAPALTTLMRINESGNVSIGTANPSARLHVVSVGGFGTEPIRAQANGTFFSGVSTAGTPRFAINNDGETASPILDFEGWDTTWFNFMNVNNSGSRLVTFNALKGVSAFTQYGAFPQIFVNGDNRSGGGIAISDDGGFYDYNDGWVTYNGNGTAGLRIAGDSGVSSGGETLNVQDGVIDVSGYGGGWGAGTYTSPNAQVSINGNQIWESVPASGGTLYLQYSNPNGAVQIGKDTTQTNNFNVYGTETLYGNEAVYGGVWANGPQWSPSDIRLKENIVPLQDTLSKIDQLRGVSFQWNHQSKVIGKKEGERSIGMIAQEVQKVYPELVGSNKMDGKEEYLAIDYPKFTAVLLQAVKELKSQMNTMQEQINVLQDKVKMLEKQK